MTHHPPILGRLVFGLGILWWMTAAQAEPQRIVAAGGSVTEIVYALGAEDRLAGVDSTSLHPAAAHDLPNVGYLRALSAEPVLSLDPDLILAEADAGPPETLDQLRAAGVEVILVPDEHGIQGVASKIRAIAGAVGKPAAGRQLADSVIARYATLATRIATIDSHPRVMFALSAGHGAPLVAGEGTSAEAIIRMAGGINAIRGFAEYRPLSPEAGIAASPDVILVTRRTLERLGGPGRLIDLPGISGTPAAENGRIIAIDGLLLLGFGPRTPEAVRQLAEALHPGLDLGAAGQ